MINILVDSFKDLNIFNSINPDALQPKAKKPLPFPLENFDEVLANAYTNLDTMLKKIQASKSNPINNTKAKKRRLNSLEYRTKTMLQMLKQLSDDCQELWY